MNVYIESLYKELSGSNCSIDIFTKCHKSHFEKVTQISPSLRVIHVDGIPENIEKNDAFSYLPHVEHAIENFVSKYSSITDIDVINKSLFSLLVVRINWIVAKYQVENSSCVNFPHIGTKKDVGKSWRIRN